MDTIATPDDVEDLWIGHGELTDEERSDACALLRQVEALIVRRVPNLRSRAQRNRDFRTRVVGVEVAAVLRVMRNPEGYRQETEGNYGYSLNSAVAAGHLFVMDSEWRQLGVRGAWTVAPRIRRPRRGITRTWDGW